MVKSNPYFAQTLPYGIAAIFWACREGLMWMAKDLSNFDVPHPTLSLRRARDSETAPALDIALGWGRDSESAPSPRSLRAPRRGRGEGLWFMGEQGFYPFPFVFFVSFVVRFCGSI